MTPERDAWQPTGGRAPEPGGVPPASGQVGGSSTRPPLLESVEVTIDTVDAGRAVEFWSAALDYEERYRRGVYVVLGPTGARVGPTVLIQRLLEGVVTAGARATHLDLRSVDPAALVRRLVGLGARVVRVVEDEGRSWVVMEDPEGIRFCVCEARVAQGSPEPSPGVGPPVVGSAG